jgi:2-C-methyl-D-erythritol 2,4-cyclodiphosphate synthase
MSIRIGFGYDVHRLTEGRKCIIGGVEIPFEKGLLGHSDADVLLHAITDALLGALALGDIGTFFPDTDPAYKDADSKKLLADSYQMILDKGYELVNLDATVIAQKPRLNPYISEIRESIAEILNTDFSRISVKATTNEKLDAIGRSEGIAVHAVVLLNEKKAN